MLNININFESCPIYMHGYPYLLLKLTDFKFYEIIQNENVLFAWFQL